MSNMKKMWMWLGVCIVCMLGMGYFGTHILSGLIVSVLFALTYVVAAVMTVVYAARWINES